MNQWARMTESEQTDRLWSHIDMAFEGCWNWSPAKRYGNACFKGKRWQAHRLMWTLQFGPIPEGMCVCHTCDNPKCVRPSHLFLGDMKANMRDAVEKRRHPCVKLADQTHCKRGHEFTPENTRLNSTGHRVCRACENYRRRKS